MKADHTIISRIKKLFALANSTSSAAEAASALRKAQELMQAHEITLTDDPEMIFQENWQTLKKGRIPAFVLGVIETIDQAFGVAHMIAKRTDGRYLLTYIGTESRVTVAEYASRVIIRAIYAARKAYYDRLSKRWKQATRVSKADSYAEGWIYAASQHLPPYPDDDPQYVRARRWVEGVKKRAGEMESLKARHTTTRTAQDAERGMQDGSKFRLRRGLDQAAPDPAQVKNTPALPPAAGQMSLF